jgi:hypothetical protein
LKVRVGIQVHGDDPFPGRITVPHDLAAAFQVLVHRHNIVETVPVDVSYLPVSGCIVVQDDVLKGKLLGRQATGTEGQHEKEREFHFFPKDIQKNPFMQSHENPDYEKDIVSLKAKIPL